MKIENSKSIEKEFLLLDFILLANLVMIFPISLTQGYRINGILVDLLMIPVFLYLYKRHSFKINLTGFFLIGSMIVFSLIGALTSHLDGVSISGTVKMLSWMIYFVLGCSIANYYIKIRSDFERIKVDYFVYSLLVLNVFLILMYLINPFPLFFYAAAGGRLRGLFGDPNFFAISEWSFFMLVLLYANKSLVKGLAIFSIIVVHIMSGSRGTAIAVLVAPLFFLKTIFTQIKAWINIKNMLLFVLVVAFVLVFLSGANFQISGLQRIGAVFNSLLSNKFKLSIVELDYFLHGRLQIWQSSLKCFTSYPLFGIGKDNITAWNIIYTGRPYVVHNTYLEMLTSSGIMGLMSFFFLLIYSFARSIKKKRRIWAMWVVIFILVASLFYSLDNFRLFWFALGILCFNVGQAKNKVVNPRDTEEANSIAVQ